MKHRLIAIGALLVTVAAGMENRPGLFFREDSTTQPPFEHVTQEDVANPNLLQTLYGPAKEDIKKRHHGTDEDPYYIWSRKCAGTWALTLKHKDTYVDLTGRSKVRWRTRNSGYRRVHVILKLADGTGW